MKDEHIFDTLERMESIIPEYSYNNINKVVNTDKRIKEFVVSEAKKIKDYMFHVVQVSFELQRDRLSDAAEGVWDDVKSLMNKTEASKIAKMKGKKECDDCKKRVQDNLYHLIRKDRELVIAVKDMKASVYAIYRELFTRGRENYFIKNLDKIKTYIDGVLELLDERDAIIKGG